MDAKLNAIVGAAVRALVESGADDLAIGAFAAAHRAKVAQVLGTPGGAATAGPPDLVEVVREAVRGVLDEYGLPTGRARIAKLRINVEVNGQRTSVTVDRRVFAKLATIEGSESKAAAAIKKLAATVPADVAQRSKWIEEQAQARIQLAAMKLPPAESLKH